MLLMTVLIVMIISVALLLALFSGFLPFVNMYWNVAQYTTAYYGAMSAIERWSLAIRYAGPGFDWESWWESEQGEISFSTWNISDAKLDNFYTYGDGNDSLVWNIHSSTDRIPSLGDGNVDPNFISNANLDSRNYNTLDYTKTELIPLGTVGQVLWDGYYTNNKDFNLHHVDPWFSLEGEFRLNPFLFAAFSPWDTGLSKLCQTNCPWSRLNDWRDNNQVVATWTIKGEYSNWWLSTEFTALPKDWTNLGQENIWDQDTLIRKKQINQGPLQGLDTVKKMILGDNRHPFLPEYQDSFNIISNNEQELQDLWTFSAILTNEHVNNTSLSFSLVNFLRSQGNSLYPFLEYSFATTNGARIADRFYTLQGEGKVGSYNVRLQVKKPTLDQPALWNFTIIF